jgi:mRNA interferase MazF
MSELMLHRYDIVDAEIKIRTLSGSIQVKRRPYVLVGNEQGTKAAPIVIAMPLTHVIKKENLPVHGCIEANGDTGLASYSMVLGEQPTTLDKKHDIIRKVGTVVDQKQKNMINKICFNTLFMGEDINWKEVLA